MSEHWNTWLQTSQVPPDQLQELADTLSSWGIQAKTKNGHNTTTATLKESDEGVTIVRQSADDLLITDCPPYEDVMGLLPLYERLAFRENLLLKGPKGTGKTLSQLFFASGITAPVVVLECSEDTKNRNLIGSFYLKGRETPYILGAMPTAIDIANEVGNCIIAFEEINALTPQVQKELNALLDFRTMVSIPQIGKTYKLREGAHLWAVATMNPCFHPDTDILTPDGIKNIADMKIGDPVYSFNKDTGEVELDTVANVWGHPADDMLLIENQHTKLRVTPEHKLVVKGRNASQWGLAPAEEMAEWMEDKGPTNSDKFYPKPFNIPQGEWEKTHVIDLSQVPEWLPKTNTKNTCKTTYVMEDFLCLLGWYISEGSSYLTEKGEYRVHIAQEYEENLNDIEETLDAMEVRWFSAKKGTKKSGVVFNDKVLYHALRHYGGIGSHGKIIHHDLFKLPKNQLQVLFDSMYAGDGDTVKERKNHQWAKRRGTKVHSSMRYSTVSETLYKDFLWLANYLDYTTTRHKDSEGVYRIGLRPAKPYTTHLTYERIPYDGWVINLEVSKNRTVCAGEDGKFLFVSNSVYGGTYDLNEDLRSRWDEVEIDYPPPGAEKRIVMANVQNDGSCPDDEFGKRIDMCIRLAGESRQTNTSYALSSRDVVRMMRDTQVLGVEAALQLVACKFEGDDRKTIIKRISSIFPKVYPKNSWGASK